MNFSDPHWAFILPAYAITALTFVALAGHAVVSLMQAAKRARDEEGRS